MRATISRGVLDGTNMPRSEEHTSELQSLRHLVCRLLLEKKKKTNTTTHQRNNKKQRNKRQQHKHNTKKINHKKTKQRNRNNETRPNYDLHKATEPSSQAR